MEIEGINPHMGIDDILALLDSDHDVAYHKLNMILWSLQEKNIITFDEDALDREDSEPEY